jgi:hypothetical protein
MNTGELPQYLRSRPTWGGYVVPWFVAWYKDGKLVDERVEGAIPSFPTVDYGKLVQAHKRGRCWICGHPMGSNRAFVFGPASAISGQTGEPPSHLMCAGYAVVTCPFMLNPDRQMLGKKRPHANPDAARTDVADYNPGMQVIWVTKDYKLSWPGPKTPIFEPKGQPVSIQFWREGKRATYKQVADGFQNAITKSGLAKVMAGRDIAFAVYNLMKWVGERP